jgi:hypothetical protein
MGMNFNYLGEGHGKYIKNIVRKAYVGESSHTPSLTGRGTTVIPLSSHKLHEYMTATNITQCSSVCV